MKRSSNSTFATISLTLLVVFGALINFVQCVELSKEEKHQQAVEAMEKKLKNIKLNEHGRSLPFIVGGPNGETLFIVKYSDGTYKTSPTGVPVAPSPDDITRWLFVQEDGSLGESPAPEYAEKIKKRAEKYHRVKRGSESGSEGEESGFGMEGSSSAAAGSSSAARNGRGYGGASGKDMKGVDKKKYNRQKYLEREKRIRKAQMRRKVEV